MGALECAGCTMTAFGPCLAIFLIVIVRDPLRVILFVAGAFFWLLALLISALLWYAVVPLRETAEFGLFFSVVAQEAFRYLYYRVVQKAESGLDKVSQNGMHIDGVHSLKNAKHTIALVCGLGFGFMSGAFALVNVLADANGPGTVGFPSKAGLINEDTGGAGKDFSYNFFFTSAVTTSAFVILHVFWNVLFWHGCRTGKFVLIGFVIGSHFLLSGLSLLNVKALYAVSLTVTYVVLLITAVYTFYVTGGSATNIRSWGSELIHPTTPNVRNNNNNGQQQAIEQAPAAVLS